LLLKNLWGFFFSNCLERNIPPKKKLPVKIVENLTGSDEVLFKKRLTLFLD